VILTTITGGDAANADDFNSSWVAEFRNTNAYAVWDRITDPLIFDIVEPRYASPIFCECTELSDNRVRHPCTEKPSVVADLGLRLSEGIQDLKLDQQLAPAREAVVRTFASGSTSFLKAVEGVRERWTQQRQSSTPNISAASDTSKSSTTTEVSKSDLKESSKTASRSLSLFSSFTSTVNVTAGQNTTKRDSSASGIAASLSDATTIASATANNVSTWSSGIGSFFSSRLARTRSNDLPVSQAPLTMTPTAEKPLILATPVESSLPSSPVLVSPSATPAEPYVISMAGKEDLIPSESEEFVIQGLGDLDVRRSQSQAKDAYGDGSRD